MSGVPPLAKFALVTNAKTIMYIISEAMTTAFDTWSSAEGISAIGKLSKLRRDHPTRKRIMSRYVYAASKTRSVYRSIYRTVHSLQRVTYAELSVVRDVLLGVCTEGEVTFHNPTAFHWWWDFFKVKVEVERRPRFETEKGPKIDYYQDFE